MYIYNADLYCDDCGRAIKADLQKEWREANGDTFDAIKILRTLRRDPELQSVWLPEEEIRIPGRPVSVITLLQDAIEYLHESLPLDPEDEDNGDSEGYPQYADEDSSETDSPYHCGSHEKCINAQQFGTLPNGEPFITGCLIRENLTSEGRQDVIKAIEEDPSSELMIEWASAFDIKITWTATLSAYCGMSFEIAEEDSEEEIRVQVANYLRTARKDYPVVTLKRGKEWEILEPEDNTGLVSDDCGILVLQVEVK